MFKDERPWPIKFTTYYNIKSWWLWYVTCNSRTWKFNAFYGGSWMQLLRKKGWVRSFSRGSWQMVRKQNKMLALFMILESLWWRWLTKSKCVFPLDLVFRQTYKIVDHSWIPWSTQALCYDYKKATSMEEVDLWYLPFSRGGII